MSSLLSRTSELQYHFVHFLFLMKILPRKFSSDKKKRRKCKIVSMKFIELFKEIKENEKGGGTWWGEGVGYNNKYDEKLTKENL